MILLDGKTTSAFYKEQLKEEVQRHIAKGHRPPHLAAVLVGNNVASHTYVNSKIRNCGEVGIQSSLITFNENVSEAELLKAIRTLNDDKNIDGFIVQLPLPSHINVNKITEAIDPVKDVDGFHPYNQGRMLINEPSLLPATPLGILMMLQHYKIKTAGKHCAIVGRSNIVGLPLSVLMQRNAEPGNCTVTLCHSRTKNLNEILLQADIVVAAIGKAKFIKADMIKEGAIVIDVGINSLPDATKKSGYQLVGDVDFESVAPKSSYITPVPGGVGLMTIVALLSNTLQAYRDNGHS